MARNTPSYIPLIIAICIILVIAGIFLMALPDTVPKEIGTFGWAPLAAGACGLFLIWILQRQKIAK